MRSRLVAALAVLLLSPALAACDGSPLGEDTTGSSAGGGGATGADAGDGGEGADPPTTGTCRVLDAEAIAAAADATDPVECTESHNAETFYVGEFTKADDLAYDDPSLSARVYQECNKRYIKHVGATRSLALRTVIDWAWWRPTEDAWDEGARWFRCDVVGGNDQSAELVDLPPRAKGLLLGIPADKWMLCAAGEVVAEAPKVPCSEKHVWRAVGAVSMGKPKNKWPGQRLVEVTSRDYCSDWVGNWLHYPLDYEFGYTYFGKAEWEVGNRQSVCWAKPDK